MIYWNGCSFVKGYELKDRTLNFVNKVSDHFNQSWINDAKVGGSNDRIFRTTIEYCLKNKPNLVIIMWSGINRQEYLEGKSNTWYQINWTKHKWNLLNGNTDKINSIINRHPSNDEDEYQALKAWALFKNAKQNLIHTLNYMIALKYFLTARKIPYLYYNFSDGQYIPILHFLDEKYSEGASIKWEPSVKLTKEDYLREVPHITDKIGMYDFAKKNGYKIGPKDHPLEDAHQAYGEYIIKDIHNNEYDKILV